MAAALLLILACFSCGSGNEPAETAGSSQSLAPPPDSVEDARRLIQSADSQDILSALGMMYRLADPALLPELEKGMTDGPEVIRKGCAMVLARIGEAAMPVLTRALAHTDWRVRNNAVVAIGLIKKPEALQMLEDMMDDPHMRVKIATVEAMAEIGGEEAAGRLVVIAKKQPRKVRIAICEALGKIGTDNALEALPTFFTDEYFFVRYYAAEAVVLGGERAAPYLVNLLAESTDVRARALAARALGAIKSPQAVQPLILALQDPSPTVRRLAVWSLGNIASADGWAALQEIKKRGSWSERKHARYALDKMVRQELFEKRRPGSVMY
jgi:HEAT repeat protein